MPTPPRLKRSSPVTSLRYATSTSTKPIPLPLPFLFQSLVDSLSWIHSSSSWYFVLVSFYLSFSSSFLSYLSFNSPCSLFAQPYPSHLRLILRLPLLHCIASCPYCAFSMIDTRFRAIEIHEETRDSKGEGGGKRIKAVDVQRKEKKLGRNQINGTAS